MHDDKSGWMNIYISAWFVSPAWVLVLFKCPYTQYIVLDVLYIGSATCFIIVSLHFSTKQSGMPAHWCSKMKNWYVYLSVVVYVHERQDK